MTDASEFTATNKSAQRSSALIRIAAIARNAFREAVRDRVLYNLVFFVLLLTAAAIFLGELSGGQERKIIVDLGLSAMLLFGVFISIFVGVGLVYKEIERRTIYAIFSKPVGRGEFLVGKFLGLCLTLLVNVLVMGLGVSLALVYVSRGWDPLVITIWPAVLLDFTSIDDPDRCGNAIFSIFFSGSLGPTDFLCVHHSTFSGDLKSLATSMGSAPARWFFGALYYLLPNLSNFSYITPAAHGIKPGDGMTVAAIAYAVVYIGIVLAAATLILNRRNFK